MSRAEALDGRLESSPLLPVPAQRPRIDFLDGVRALAALYVVAHHIWLTAYPQFPAEGGPRSLRWLAFGHLGVAVFIVVSGFSLSIAPARRLWRLQGGFPTFIRRRAWRILPTYWAALLLSSAVFGLITASSTGDRVSLKALVVHAVLLQDLVDSPKPNGVFWSIAIEWQIYFFFPAILLLLRRAGLVVLLCAGVLAASLAQTLGLVGPWPLSKLLDVIPQFAALFVMGVCAMALASRPLSKWRARAVGYTGAALSIGLVLLLTNMSTQWTEAHFFLVDLLAGLAASAMLAAITMGQHSVVRRLLASRPLRQMGLFSYSIYCVHLPILWLIWHFAIARLFTSPITEFIALSAVGVPAVVLSAYLFYLPFERPFLTARSFRDVAAIVARRAPRADTGKREPSAIPRDSAVNS